MSLSSKLKRTIFHTPEYASYFNVPVKFSNNDWCVNERIVENPFVIGQLNVEDNNKRVLDFGCTRSLLALELASLGFSVTGVDLRQYNFTHPNLTSLQINLKELSTHEPYDYIVAISVLEHVGLGAYGEPQDSADLVQVANKLAALLGPGGKLIVTVPTGMPHRDDFLRSFSYEQITSLFDLPDLRLTKTAFFRRESFKFWRPCSHNELAAISNAPADRGPTGVNGVGCYVWKKVG